VGDVYQSAPSPRFGSAPLWHMGIQVIGAVQSPRVRHRERSVPDVAILFFASCLML